MSISMSLKIRKLLVSAEDLLIEGEQALNHPVRKVVAAAVFNNPYAGQRVINLDDLASQGAALGELLATRAMSQMLPNTNVVTYGKAAIVGLKGELEHAAALLHPCLGKPMRTAIGGGKAVIPSVTKRAAAGSSLDIPLHMKDDEWSFDHFDTATLSIVDAPCDDEILVAIAFANSGRPLARVSKP